MLYLVPTPIGNLKDITLRALEVLKEVDLVLAEDTRNTIRLLKHYDISVPLQAFHSHNEHKQLEKHINALREGKKIALVSDAGTPGISDPGFLLVRACLNEDIPYSCLPGATAFVPAVVMSGMPATRFYFEGFLPQKKGRKTRLEYLNTIQCTLVLYESPYRIIKLLNEIELYFKEGVQVCVIREISKIYEEKIAGTLPKVKKIFAEKATIKGEFVVCIDNNQ